MMMSRMSVLPKRLKKLSYNEPSSEIELREAKGEHRWVVKQEVMTMARSQRNNEETRHATKDASEELGMWTFDSIHRRVVSCIFQEKVSQHY